MKKPRRRSKRKARSVLTELQAIDESERERMAEESSYWPSPYHKRSHSFEVVQPRPRRDKTVCDSAEDGDFREDARMLLASGFRRGMVSAQKRGGWPQNVWAVGDDDTVYEAQLTNRGQGEYHGYPMKGDDEFRCIVLREWKARTP